MGEKNDVSIIAAFDDITESLFIHSRYLRAPKNARSSTTAPPAKFCKGVCHRFEIGKPHGRPYNTAAFCSSCGNDDGVWLKLEDLNEKGRCPCCNRRPRRKAFKQ